jgi:nitrogen regulatory protein P-II 1
MRKDTTMKLIIAIISPNKLQAVQAALGTKDVHSVTVSEVVDCREADGRTEIYRGRVFRRPASKLRLEIAVDDSFFDAAVQAIERVTTSDEACPDDAFIMGLDQSVRIGDFGRDPVSSARSRDMTASDDLDGVSWRRSCGSQTL